MSDDRLLSIYSEIAEALSAIGGLCFALDRTINDTPELEGRGEEVNMFRALVAAQRLTLQQAERVVDTIWPDRGLNPQTVKEAS